LKKNCPPELIIYIVGSKADLHRHRQVTSDLARLSLHNWFPPPRIPTPPPPPTSTLSYIRPRFTSFPGLRSPPFISMPSVSPEGPAYLDLPPNRSSGLQWSKTTAQTSPKISRSLTRPTTSRTPHSSRFGSFGQITAWNDNNDNSSNSIEEADEDDDDCPEWGLSKGMELFEVSAKDDIGIHNLFEHLISAIIVRKDIIEQENELKKRDSVFLSSVSTPEWSLQADEEEEQARRSGAWSCC